MALRYNLYLALRQTYETYAEGGDWEVARMRSQNRWKWGAPYERTKPISQRGRALPKGGATLRTEAPGDPPENPKKREGGGSEAQLAPTRTRAVDTRKTWAVLSTRKNNTAPPAREALQPSPSSCVGLSRDSPSRAARREEISRCCNMMEAATSKCDIAWSGATVLSWMAKPCKRAVARGTTGRFARLGAQLNFPIGP
jgi:hypothetical protein